MTEEEYNTFISDYVKYNELVGKAIEEYEKEEVIKNLTTLYAKTPELFFIPSLRLSDLPQYHSGKGRHGL